MDGPRGLRPTELDACMTLVDRVFRSRPGQSPTMRQEFPLLFDPANAGRLRVIADGDRVVCHIGVLCQTILVGDSELPVASIGAVCTDPAYRGRGLATATLADAIAMMRRDGRVLLLISGDRDLYRRQGCVHVGRRVVFLASAADLAPLADPALAVRPRRGEADLAEMRRLYAEKPVRYARTAETLRRLLGGLESYGNTTLMVERGGAVVAYLVVRHGGPMAWWGPGVGRVMEYAGEPQAVAGALGPAADLLAVSQLSVPVHGRDEAILGALQSAGLVGKEEGLTGIFCVLDAVGLVRRLGPWWRERLGDEAGASIEAVEENGEPTGLALGGRVLAVPGTAAFTRLLFSADAPASCGAPAPARRGQEAQHPSPPRGDPSGAGRSEGRGVSPSAQPAPAGLPGRERVSAGGMPHEVFRAVGPALPVPLPDSGLNYV